MSPQSTVRPSRIAQLSRYIALVSLVFFFATGSLFAQQQWPQNSQYPSSQPQYAQPNPYAGQYAPNPQPNYSQQPNYAQQAYPQPDDSQPQAQSQPLSADQLDQLVAPVALYPDTLVAQILAAATYPAQVVGADHWLQAQGNAPPEQIAYAANAQPWDPSVKALTAFPQVLALLDRDLQWTTDLGNAYYNQPQDVLQTVQVLRQRAQSAGNLQNTPQESVTDNQGYIQVAPTNQQVVYVPAYNPWDVYGQPIQPYSGFSLLGSLESFAGSSPVQFGLGIAMSAFNHTPFGWATWALNWLTQSVLFNHSNYESQSTSVAHWGNNPRQGLPRTSQPLDAYNRNPGNGFRSRDNYGDYNRPAPTQPISRPPFRTPVPYPENRPYAGSRSPYENRSVEPSGRDYPRQQSGSYPRPALSPYDYNRPRQQSPMTAREQADARPGGYGSGFYSNSSPYAGRPVPTYDRQQSPFRAQEYAPRNQFAQRSYSQPYSENRGYQPSRDSYQPSPRQEHTGGFHLFGGGHNGESSHNSFRAPKPPKAPKGYGGGGHSGGGHSFGGGHSSGGGHHGGGHRF